MKRGVWIAMLILVTACIGACGRGGTTVTVTPMKTDKPAETAGPVSGTASGPAVTKDERTQISEMKAFDLAEDILADMTLEEKIGQMFMVHLSEIDPVHTADGNQYYVTKNMKKVLGKYNIGGIYLTQNNIANKEQTRKLTSGLQQCVSGSALYIAVEEEGGGDYSISEDVGELREGGVMSPSEMARELSADQVEKKSRKIASELMSVGINLNLAPTADVGTEENKDYAKRCFGTEQDLCETMIESFINGMGGEGLAMTLKYFPGIGNVAGNAQTELLESTDNLMTLRSDNFALYTAGIEAGADAVMVSNVSVNKVTLTRIPAFMSSDIVTSLLRDELGFEGVIMTPFLDDPVIKDKYTPGFAAVEAVKAGCDMIILPENWKESYDALRKAVERGEITEKVINTAVSRILQNKIRRGILVLDNKNE